MNRPVALITGGGKRMGRQIAIALARKGFDLAVNYHKSSSGAHQTVKLIRAIGSRAIALKADITDRSQVRMLIENVMKHFKTIDVLINNSGVFITASLAKTTDRLWQQALDVNLKGPFLTSQIVSRTMLKQKRGRIINIASLGGIKAWSNHLAYSVSKAGLIMLTRCLAKDLAPHIMVNAVAPGTIIFPDEENPRQRHVARTSIPLRRYGNPSDISDLVIYLATTANYITGQTISVDGGRSV